jgi:hypothetical protein
MHICFAKWSGGTSRKVTEHATEQGSPTLLWPILLLSEAILLMGPFAGVQGDCCGHVAGTNSAEPTEHVCNNSRTMADQVQILLQMVENLCVTSNTTFIIFIYVSFHIILSFFG